MGACTKYSMTIAVGIPWICHISLHRLEMHFKDNFPDMHNDGFMLFTLSNL